MASPGVRQGLFAVHVLITRLDHELGDSSVEERVLIVDDSLRNVHVDATDGVDDVDEAVEVHEGVVVDGDAEELRDHTLDCVLRRFAGTLEGFRVLLSLDPELVDQFRVAVAVPDPHAVRKGGVRPVPGYLKHRSLAGFGVDADRDHRVGADSGSADTEIAAKEQDVQAVQIVPRCLLDNGRRG